MKLTLALPDQLLRKAKATAAEGGKSLKEFITEALRDKLAREHSHRAHQPEWMEGFGKLRHLHRETIRLQAIIDEEFETIEPEDRS
jgi:metal-responsive CopG/Arc/MetJ family transcriptional regulator